MRSVYILDRFEGNGCGVVAKASFTLITREVVHEEKR